MQRDPLQPALAEAQRALDAALDQACKVDVKRATTGEMIRIEETLAVAANAAKEVVSVRLRRRSQNDDAAAPDDHAPPAIESDHVFDDADGKRWHVYAVHPSVGTLRTAALASAFQDGWLCFESHDERRRLVPIPDNWDALSEDALRVLCRNAEVATRQR